MTTWGNKGVGIVTDNQYCPHNSATCFGLDNRLTIVDIPGNTKYFMTFIDVK